MSDDIILKFTNANILINDKAYERIINQENSIKFTELLIEDIVYSNENMVILTEEILDQYLEKNGPKDQKNSEISLKMWK
jgi:DNA polymerase II small subunit